MAKPSRQVVVVVCMLFAAAASYRLMAARYERGATEAGFWFEPVAYASSRLPGAVTTGDMQIIESVARSELSRAFGGLPIRFSGRRDSRYRIRVVQDLRDMRLRRYVGVAGESRAISGIGGVGAVSFFYLASGAVAYAPEDADRASMIEAIGRGIGRTAVHEFTHQFLPTAPIHDSRDVRSYEYSSAARREQYYGDMHWGIAWPLLQQRLERRRVLPSAYGDSTAKETFQE